MSEQPRPFRKTTRASSSSGSTPRGPEPLGEILSRLFTSRGWGRRQGRLHLEQVWQEVLATQGVAANQTQVAGIRRGVLEIVVANAVLLQELTHFYKRRLLEGLRARLTGTTLTDLRFRTGTIDQSQPR